MRLALVEVPMRQWALILTCWCSLAGPALAAARVVAVLPVSPELPDVPWDDLDTLEHGLRAVAQHELADAGYELLDKATIHTALRKLAGGPDASCGEHCAEQAARVLPADLYISEQLVRSGNRFLMAIRLVNRQGQVLSLARLESVHLPNLATQFAAKADPFFAGALHEDPLPAPQAAPPPSDDGFSATNALELHLEPLPGHGKWTLFNRKDEPLCDLPCVRWVGARSGYKLKAADDSPTVDVQDFFQHSWGAPLQAVPRLRSDFIMLHPAWYALAIPVATLSGLMSLGLTAALAMTAGNGESVQPEIWGIEAGSLVATALSIWWCVEISRNSAIDGVDLQPLAPGSTTVVTPAMARSLVVPPVRPEGR